MEQICDIEHIDLTKIVCYNARMKHHDAYTAPNMIAAKGSLKGALIAVSNVHDRRSTESGAQQPEYCARGEEGSRDRVGRKQSKPRIVFPKDIR